MSSEMQDKQTALDCRYIRMAQIWAENSYCKRRQVGALLVKNKTIISDGYNGTPAGFKERPYLSLCIARRSQCHY